MRRFLVMTADERTWKFEGPILFLGEWCRLHGRRHVWEKMDALVAQPYGITKAEKDKDLAYTRELTASLLNELAAALNSEHGVNHGVRYWNIALGHWLTRYVQVAFNRYRTLEQALRNYEVSGTRVFANADYRLTTPDSLTFIWASNDATWNHAFYERALRFMGDVSLDIVPNPDESVTGFDRSAKGNPVQESRLKNLAKYAVRGVLPKISTRTDAFILNSYLPRIEEVGLQASLGQFPQSWHSPSAARHSLDRDQRNRFEVEARNFTGFERFARMLVCEVLPTCFLEGYPQLVSEVSGVSWPENPRFIFTSNNFDTDEFFKIWAASKAEQGVPYFVGQHGNNYGTHFDFGNANWPELSSTDRFFSWGWSDDSRRVTPAFMFKNPSGRRKNFDARGGLLLVASCMPHRICPWDNYYEFGLSQEEQFRFAAALTPEVREVLTVRLHAENENFTWCDRQRWFERMPGVRVDGGLRPIDQLIESSRLVVHSYDSTGLLEMLASNVPTMCFWQGGVDHILPDARPYYELLTSAGILAHSPEHAAQMIATHWDSVTEWWGSETLQRARMTFCERYAKTERKPIRTMRRLLADQSKALNE